MHFPVIYAHEGGLSDKMNIVPIILIIGGAAAASWLLERTMKPLSGIVKALSFLGFFIGVILLITATGIWEPLPEVYTQYLLIVTGLTLILKPIKDIPWAALIALIVGGVCVGYIFLYVPLPDTVFGIASTWIYLIIFLVPTLMVYTFFKFLEDLLRLLGFLLASRPVAILLGLVCILQGFLLFADRSIFTLLLS